MERDKAIKDFDKAILLNPNGLFGHNCRGLLWFEKMQYDNAIKDFDEAIRIFPAGALAYIFGGIACLGRRDSDTAVKNFNEALRCDPEKAREILNFFWFGLGGDTLFPDEKEVSQFSLQLMIFALWPFFTGPGRDEMVRSMLDVLISNLIGRQHEIIKRRYGLNAG